MPSDVQPGDLVLVAAGGRVFYARILGHEIRASAGFVSRRSTRPCAPPAPS
jgi:hypothetical protein